MGFQSSHFSFDHHEKFLDLRHNLYSFVSNLIISDFTLEISCILILPLATANCQYDVGPIHAIFPFYYRHLLNRYSTNVFTLVLMKV